MRQVLRLCLMAVFYVFMCLEPVEAGEILYAWGMDMDSFRRQSSGVEFISFHPSVAPNYKNRIMTYIIGIDMNTRDKMEVLRLNSRPVADYLFVNKKLFSVLEDHGETAAANVQALHNRLVRQFGKGELKQEGLLSVYSFADQKTKVLLYAEKIDDGKIKCKVYYYPKKLFMMLLNY